MEMRCGVESYFRGMAPFRSYHHLSGNEVGIFICTTCRLQKNHIISCIRLSTEVVAMWSRNWELRPIPQMSMDALQKHKTFIILTYISVWETHGNESNERNATPRKELSRFKVKEVEKSFRKDSNSCEYKIWMIYFVSSDEIGLCVSEKIDRHMKLIEVFPYIVHSGAGENTYFFTFSSNNKECLFNGRQFRIVQIIRPWMENCATTFTMVKFNPQCQCIRKS